LVILIGLGRLNGTNNSRAGVGRSASLLVMGRAVRDRIKDKINVGKIVAFTVTLNGKMRGACIKGYAVINLGISPNWFGLANSQS
jgi:hypothetical protein